MTCPHCGKDIATRQKVTRIRPIDDGIVPDTSSFTTAELYAYYKRTAPRFDVEFWIKNAVMPDALRREFQNLHSDILYTNIVRADIYKRLTALQEKWRAIPRPDFVAWRVQQQQRAIDRRDRRSARTAFYSLRESAIERVQCASVQSDSHDRYGSKGYDSSLHRVATPDDAYAITRELVQAARRICPRRLSAIQSIEVAA